ncbi:hypothetical protein BDN72DRAFT_780331, partial [Pluteus cervinus]
MFETYCSIKEATQYQDTNVFCVVLVPLSNLSQIVTRQILDLLILPIHNIHLSSHIKKANIPVHIKDHDCSKCSKYVSVFRLDAGSTLSPTEAVSFPPMPLSQDLVEETISGFCNDITSHELEEHACAVCGQLTPKKLTRPL